MESRVDVSRVAAKPYGIVIELERYVKGRVDRRILELVKLRASMLNGCAFCVDMHTTESLDHGEDPRRWAHCLTVLARGTLLRRPGTGGSRPHRCRHPLG
jgi:AhpD family alkylhydroperoxidase